MNFLATLSVQTKRGLTSDLKKSGSATLPWIRIRILMVFRVLERIAEEHSSELSRYTVLITAMIDNIDSMSLAQFRQVTNSSSSQP